MRATGNIVARELSSRICAALGAACFVAGFALGVLMHPWATLAEALASWDRQVMSAWDHAERSGIWLWLWTHAMQPLLERPSWVVPTGLGLVFFGAALTLASKRQGNS